MSAVHPGWALTGVLGAAVLGLLGILINNWFQNRRDQHALCLAINAANERLIDQLQEERTETKATLAKATEKVDRVALRQRYSEDYIQLLRAHIAAGSPPPPPEYPAGLLSI